MSTDEQKETQVVSQGSSAIAEAEGDEVAILLEGRPYFRVLVLLFTVALLYAMRSSLSPFLVGGALLALLVFVQRGVSFELGIGLVVILLLLVWFLDELTGLLWPFVTSFVLAYLMAPLVEVMERWISRTLAIGLVVVLLLGALVSVGVVLVPLVIEEVGEFVAGDLLGRLAGAAAGDPGNASKRRSAGWISVPERDVDARVTAAQVHFTHAPETKSGVGEFRLGMWPCRCNRWRPRRQAHTVQTAADRTRVGEGGDDPHRAAAIRTCGHDSLFGQSVLSR